MVHVIAVISLAASVIVWHYLQRATGRSGRCESCGCGGGTCQRDGEGDEAPEGRG